MKPTITLSDYAVEAAARMFSQMTGVSISMPWDGCLDDEERGRYEGFRASFSAAITAMIERGDARMAVGWEDEEEWQANAGYADHAPVASPPEFPVLIIRTKEPT